MEAALSLLKALPEQVAQCERSWTGKFLKDML